MKKTYCQQCGKDNLKTYIKVKLNEKVNYNVCSFDCFDELEEEIKNNDWNLEDDQSINISYKNWCKNYNDETSTIYIWNKNKYIKDHLTFSVAIPKEHIKIN